MSQTHQDNKARLAPLRAALYDFEPQTVQEQLRLLLSDDALCHWAHPFGDVSGPEALYEQVYQGLYAAWPDLERRDYIVMAGGDAEGHEWVGCGGYYTGSFVAPWLGIPPTGHQVAMRFHEFYRFEAGRVVEIQALWDIPEVMMQARAWPMAPSLGREWQVPGPSTQDGLRIQASDSAHSTRTCALIEDMLAHLCRHPSQGGPEVMQMSRFWHPRMSWYGPAGIGTARGIAGFRHWHQIPFLRAMPDRGQQREGLCSHFFAEGDYAAVTGWPNMRQTVSADGWLGIAPSGQRIELRSLDFWRVEHGLIRENWVLVDLLDAYRQLGVDVLARLQEFNKARPSGSIRLAQD